jgi:hypothetical protein
MLKLCGIVSCRDMGAALPTMKSVASPSASLAVDRAVRTVRAVRVFVVGQRFPGEREQQQQQQQQQNEPDLRSICSAIYWDEDNECYGSTTELLLCCLCKPSSRSNLHRDPPISATPSYRPRRRMGHAVVSAMLPYRQRQRRLRMMIDGDDASYDDGRPRRRIGQIVAAAHPYRPRKRLNHAAAG